MPADDDCVYATIAAERRGLVQRLHDLPTEAWALPSLCAGWSVRHVLAHLTTPFLVSAPQLMAQAVRAGGVAAAMDRIAKRLAERSTDDLLAVLHEHADSRFHPPGMPAGTPLADIVVHGADIRWALGDDHGDWGDPARLRPALDFMVSRRGRTGFVARGQLTGVRLAATDQDWSSGAGRDVRGASLHLAMGALGRSAALPHLQGDGVRLLSK